MRTGPGNRSASDGRAPRGARRQPTTVRITTDPTPRIRDAPPPRRNQSVIGPLFGRVFAWPYRWALTGLYRSGILPWQLTLLSLLANAVIGWLLIRGDRLLPGLLLIVAGLFDVFDGGVARLRGEAGPAGAFLDSVIDRVSDIILFAALFWAEAGQDHGLAAALALSTLIVSLMVSYVRAEAEAEGLKLTEGMVQRLERYVALIVGLTIPGALVPVLLILTALGGLTAIQRVITTWGQLGVIDRKARRAARERVTKSAPGFDRSRTPEV